MIDIADLSIDELIRPEGFDCSCGRHHRAALEYLKTGSGAVAELPRVLEGFHALKPFIVFDRNTKEAAWSKVKAVLKEAAIPYKPFTFYRENLEPDEAAVGALTMAFDPGCDIILGIGSGVINDCCKILSKITGKRLIIVATAPSMDGYASDSASMIQNRVKVSLPAPCPSAVIADTDILKNAPLRMLQAGLGDMLAKYTALCEWRLAHLIIGEYYCPHVAALVRRSLKKCADHAQGLVKRDPAAVEAVVEGLVLSGICMSFAGCSRPASGLEHYFSHMWEMMALDRHETADLHGIQVGVGTCLTLEVFDRLLKEEPDWALAQAHTQSFDEAVWEEQMRGIFGKAAEKVIDNEKDKYHKNDRELLARRLDAIRLHWKEIVSTARLELPDTRALLNMMRGLGMQAQPEDLGLSPLDVSNALTGSRDIRDKYLVSSLLWDLGKLEEYAAMLAASPRG